MQSSPDSLGQSALFEAALTNDVSIFDKEGVLTPELLSSYENDNTPLIWGICNSNLTFVLELLMRSEGANLEQVNLKSQNKLFLNTPLIISIAKGWTHKNAQQSARNNEYKDDPSLGQSDVAKALLDKGAKVNEVDAYGRSALFYACMHRNLEAIEALTNAGADWQLKDRDNFSPLDFCCIDYSKAESYLDLATSGYRGYTYTLDRKNFDESNDFYNKLSALLQNHNITISPQIFKDVVKYNDMANSQIDKATLSLFAHASTLFKRASKGNTWPHYEKWARACILTNVYFLNPTLFPGINHDLNKKIQSLLSLCLSLSTKSMAKINLDSANTATIIYPGSEALDLVEDEIKKNQSSRKTNFLFFKTASEEEPLLLTLKTELTQTNNEILKKNF